MKLIDMQEALIDKLLEHTGITAKSINYENDALSYSFDFLNAIDMKKAFEEYKAKMPILPPGSKQDIIFGTQEMTEKVFKHFPKYTGL
jgi:hypothetical protein